MKYSFRVFTYIYTVLFIWIINPVAGQESPGNLTDSAGIYSMAMKAYGSDQVFINGINHENYYLNALGHPFLNEDRFYPGFIVIHSKQYNNIQLKFNIFDQNLVIRQDLNNGTPVEFEPPVKFVSEFEINKMHFRKLKDESGREKFFQVVYDGDIKFLNFWSKQRVVSFHNARVSSFRFDEEVKKSYLLLHNTFYRFSSAGSFQKIFPKELIPEIKSFCRKESIRPGKGSDESLKKLTAFCDDLLKRNEKSFSGKPQRTN